LTLAEKYTDNSRWCRKSVYLSCCTYYTSFLSLSTAKWFIFF